MYASLGHDVLSSVEPYRDPRGLCKRECYCGGRLAIAKRHLDGYCAVVQFVFFPVLACRVCHRRLDMKFHTRSVFG